MFNKFKKGDKVIVNGIGKCNETQYKDKIAIIIKRDYFFKDYNIKLKDGTEDWIDEEYLKKVKGEEVNEN